MVDDITIPFILPLMPTVTHIFPQPQHFPEYCGRRFTKLFSPPVVRTQIQSYSSVAVYLPRRAWLIPTVVQSSVSSVELLGLLGYRDVQHIPSCGFGRHLAHIHDGYSKTLVHACYMPPIHKPTLQTVVVGTMWIWV